MHELISIWLKTQEGPSSSLSVQLSPLSHQLCGLLLAQSLQAQFCLLTQGVCQGLPGSLSLRPGL